MTWKERIPILPSWLGGVHQQPGGRRGQSDYSVANRHQLWKAESEYSDLKGEDYWDHVEFVPDTAAIVKSIIEERYKRDAVYWSHLGTYVADH